MMPFTYNRPDGLDEATQLTRAEGAVFLAGSQSLLRDMKRGLRHHAALVDLGGLLGRSITLQADALQVEATATHAEVAASSLVQEALSLLSGMAGHIADPLVRHRATIGGAIAANEVAGDYPALALGATVVITRRHLSADAFLTESGTTALDRGEIVLAVRFPRPARGSYVKILNPAARYAMVGACAAMRPDGLPRLAITGASISGAFRWAEAEQALATAFSLAALDAAILPPIARRENLFGYRNYRAQLVRVMARRAVQAALDADAIRVFSHGAPIPGGTSHRQRD